MNAASTRCSPERRRTSSSRPTSWPSWSHGASRPCRRSRRRVKEAELAGDKVTHDILVKRSTRPSSPRSTARTSTGSARRSTTSSTPSRRPPTWIVLYRLGAVAPEMPSWSTCSKRAAAATAEAMPRLETMTELQEYWIEVNPLENEADRTYRMLLGRSSSGSTTPPTVLKVKEVVESSRRPRTRSRRWPTPSRASRSRSPGPWSSPRSSW